MKANDPDEQTHEVMPRNTPAQAKQTAPAAPATVTTQATVPAPQPKPAAPAEPKPETAATYIKLRRDEIKAKWPEFDFIKARAALIAGGVVEDIPSAKMTLEQAQRLMDAIVANLKKAS